MFKLWKKKKEETVAEEQALENKTESESVLEKEDSSETLEAPSTQESVKPVEKEQKKGFFKRLTLGLKRTSTQFSSGIGNLFLGKKNIDADLLEEIEMHLLMADVGTQATQKIIDEITSEMNRKALKDPEALFKALKQSLCRILSPCDQPLKVQDDIKPFVILMVGVNGAGKTTTIGKLAKRYQQQGKRVMLAAGDTFRAAAIEQLQTWGDRNKVDVIAQKSGSDSASVIFDGLQAAKSRNIDVLIADTAGRLHTQSHLMEELKKIKRVLEKSDPQAPHETLLVLDAGIGQNAIKQAEAFNAALGLTGLVITKLDGTAKGGVIFSLAETFGIPIRFIGVGESIDDLQPFNAENFVHAIFEETINNGDG